MEPNVTVKENDKEEWLQLHNEDTTFVADEDTNGDTSTKPSNKRKKPDDCDDNIVQVFDVFLRIIYPLTSCFEKNITIGVFKSLDYTPNVQLKHLGKTVSFTEEGWNGFNKSINLVECYIKNKLIGRKHAVRLPGCDIEVDIVKVRGAHCVRFRDLTKHDCRVILAEEEFYMMTCATPVINRYFRQLNFCGPIIKDYLVSTIENQPNVPLLTSPVDTSIFNRLPQEVNMYRKMKEFPNQLIEEDFTTLPPVNENEHSHELQEDE